MFTKGDKVSDDIEHDLEKDDVINNLVLGDSPGSFKDLGKGWTVCANIAPPQQLLGQSPNAAKEMLRLHAMRQKEQEFIGKLTNLTPKTGERLGVPNVVQLMQAHFEDFLIEHWIPKIRQKMLQHYDQGALKLFSHGVPLPNSTAYAKELEVLRSKAPAVVPSFDEQLLVTRTEKEFKRILSSRVAKVLRHETKDWMKVAERRDVLDLVAKVQQSVKNKESEWKQPLSFLQGTTALALLKKELSEQTNQLMQKLGNMVAPGAAPELVSCLVGALFQPAAQPPQGLFKNLKMLFSGSFGFTNQTDAEQAALAQLDKKPHLKKEFENYLKEHIDKINKAFMSQAQSLVTQELSEFAFQEVNAGPPVQCSVVLLRPVATAGLGHRLLSLFLNLVVANIELLAEQWEIPTTAMEEEKATKDGRVSALKMMVTATMVLTKLQDMERVARKATAANKSS